MRLSCRLLLGALLMTAGAARSAGAEPPPRVRLSTTMGEIEVELDAAAAPVTVKNFLQYVRDGFYRDTIFHRVIKDFMIQGGGFTAEMTQKPTRPPIRNEATNGLPHKRGTLAMARTPVVDSASAQFFINLKDNDFLNHRGPEADSFGYCVFGRVVQGLDVVDKIGQVPTLQRGGHGDVPREAVVIKDAVVVAGGQPPPEATR